MFCMFYTAKITTVDKSTTAYKKIRLHQVSPFPLFGPFDPEETALCGL